MDKTRPDVIEDIKDKARGFCKNQDIILIRTIPSTRFPKGAKYQGWIKDVQNNKIILWDTYVDKQIEIFISEIESPADLWREE